MKNPIDVEGLILPNESLSNFQLEDAAKKLDITNFRGVFVRDKLPKKPRVKECGILNTGDSTTNGYHWICWYKNGKTKIALPPPVELVAYLQKPVWYNSERVQFGETVICGHLCLYVLKSLNRA